MSFNEAVMREDLCISQGIMSSSKCSEILPHQLLVFYIFWRRCPILTSHLVEVSSLLVYIELKFL